MSVSGQRNPSSNPNPGGSTAQRRSTFSDNDNTLKVHRPDEYHGERNGLDDWLVQVEVYFAFSQVPDDRKTLFASTFLRGRAERWFKPTLRKYLDEDEENDETKRFFAKFGNFKKEISRVFGVSNEEQTAERSIQHLRQKTSASEYAARFQEQANLTDWDNAALMTMFRRGLKDNVKEELMRYGGDLLNLKALIEASIDLDDKLYELSLEKRYDNPRGRAGTYTGPVGYGGESKFKSKARQDPYGHVPMELDATIKARKGGKHPKGKQGSKDGKKCYSCGKPGHFARECRSGNVVPRRQFNAMLKEIPDDWEQDTWEESSVDLDTPDPSADDDEFFHIKGKEELEKVLKGEGPTEAPDSTDQVNQKIRQAINRPHTPYPESGKAPVRTNSDEQFGWNSVLEQGFQELAAVVRSNTDTTEAACVNPQDTQYIPEALFRTAGMETIDTLERILGSNASTEITIPTLGREDATVHLHGFLNWTICYDDYCAVHLEDKQGAGWFPQAPKPREPVKINCRYKSYQECKEIQCYDHIIQEVGRQQQQHSLYRPTHYKLDWNLCKEKGCIRHRSLESQPPQTKIGQQYYALCFGQWGKDKTSW